MLIAGGTVVLGGDSVGPGWAGLILLYANQFSDALLWIVRAHAEQEMGMNSVERTIEYSEIAQEPPGVVENYRPPSQVVTLYVNAF
jgi:ABC-type multidrug transport system fused ATPase/permease subunit